MLKEIPGPTLTPIILPDRLKLKQGTWIGTGGLLPAS